jgi:hypothetical protein
MSTSQPVLEAPALGPMQPPPDTDAGRQAEPVLAADQIQANIFPGFNKDAQTLLFLRITNAAAFAVWLRDFIPTVATTERVLPVRRVIKNIRSETGAEATGISVVWTNIAFSFQGLKRLESPGLKLDDFKDQAFKAGILKRSATSDGDLGDPIGSGKLGDPAGWVVGGPNREPDAVLILGGDTRGHLNQEVASLVGTLFPSTTAGGKLISSGAEIILRQDGDTLKEPLRGHEHLGVRRIPQFPPCRLCPQRLARPLHGAADGTHHCFGIRATSAGLSLRVSGSWQPTHWNPSGTGAARHRTAALESAVVPICRTRNA